MEARSPWAPGAGGLITRTRAKSREIGPRTAPDLRGFGPRAGQPGARAGRAGEEGPGLCG